MKKTAFFLFATLLMPGLWLFFRYFGEPFEVMYVFFGSVCLWAVFLAIGERWFESGDRPDGKRG